MEPRKNIGIIGAGFAGLSSAKVLSAFGHQVTLFDKASEVGGVWAAERRYPGLTTQNPRDTYALSDFPMPRDYPEWPSGEQVQAYLEAYARAFGLLRHIHLNTLVQSARYDEAAGKWRICAVRQGPAGEETIEQAFDFLIVANGIFSAPFIPDWPGSSAFTGAGGIICHTSEFNDVAPARDRHLLVVGFGKSSCDVAESGVGVARTVTVVARHLTWKMPRFIGGINFKYFMLTRMGEGLFRYIRLRGFDRFLHGPGLPLRNFMLNTVEKQIARQLDIEAAGLHPGKPFETIARSTVSMVSRDFYADAKAGRLTVKNGTEITALRPGEAELSSGETIPADVIVSGTGWHQDVPFLDRDVMAKITDARGNFRLYQSMLPVGVPGLAFNGYNSSFFSQLSAEVCALWIAEYLEGAIGLPSEAEMQSACDERLAWMEARTDGKHSKGTNIIPFSVHQMDELLNEINLNIPLPRRFLQWFKPVTGSDYAPLTNRLLARHGRPPIAPA